MHMLSATNTTVTSIHHSVSWRDILSV